MPVINILAPHVADMIAAGEVVERPASVIKELMENSIDAGARNITVEIRDGGATFIRVSDDGCGMAPEDAGVAFLRHATSKLSDERGLEAISTMGFRGEALAAISAVSQIELVTRRKGDEAGTRLTLSGGDIEQMESFGCPEGSTMIVRSLFFNTPARLKFLKSDRSEAAACQQAALRIALGHPEVSVRFIRDGKEEFFSPGDGQLQSAVYALLGRDTAKDMLKCQGSMDGMSVTGFVSSPAAGRGNRSGQYFYCNGRCIKSTLIQTALEQAYKNSLLTGRYPGCVLFVDMSFASVDVNVHPAKTEIKFSAERQVFDLVYHAVLSALGGEERPGTTKAAPVVKSQAPTASVPTARPDFYRSMSASEFREANYSLDKKPAAAQTPGAMSGQMSFHSPVPTYSASLQTKVEAKPAPSTAASLDTTGFASSDSVKIVENSVQNVETSVPVHHKIVGEALKTYIIVEQDGELIFIDKHAAHERMIFDRLKAQTGELVAQSLLTPVTLKLDGEQQELLERNAELLYQLGFEIERYGDSDWILRAVPADMLSSDAASALEEILEKLSRGGHIDPSAARDEILHTVACKAAIKAGWDTQKQELEVLVQEVLSGRVKYCPHGRPVSISMSRKDLDKQFKRIV